MITEPVKDTMMKAAPSTKAETIVGDLPNTTATHPLPDIGVQVPIKLEYHFAGGGIWRNLTVLASCIEEAEKIWLETRALIKNL